MGYTIAGDFKDLLMFYNTEQWNIKLRLFNKNRPLISELLQRNRNLPKVKIKLPSGLTLDFSQGGHNQLLREIIEEFLTRFCSKDIEVLYVGDASNRYKLRLDQKLQELGFFDLSHDLLPDVIAHDSQKNWIYLIEAFYTSGPMSEERLIELKKSLTDCKAELIFVTAFISKVDFKSHASEIGWETEVWTADHPEHLIHFNGGKFLGPYSQ